MLKHFRRLQYEHGNEPQNPDAAEVTERQRLQPVPEIRYEICHPQPLVAQRFNYDYRHRERFGINTSVKV